MLPLVHELELSGLRPEVITYRAVNSACVKGVPRRSRALLEAMLSKGLLPKVITYSALSSACVKGAMPPEPCTLGGQADQKSPARRGHRQRLVQCPRKGYDAAGAGTWKKRCT